MNDGFPELHFPDGRRAHATGIYIGRTYEGLLEGVPHAEMNRRFLARVPDRMQRIFHGAPVFVLPPAIQHGSTPHPFGGQISTATMPPVEVGMHFMSYQPISQDGDASHLVIVWHQDTATVEIPDAIRDQLERISWNDIAGDFWW